MDILVEMTNEDLQSIGIAKFGIRHRILKKVKELLHGEDEGEYSIVRLQYYISNFCVSTASGAKVAPVGVASSKPGTQLIPLQPDDKEYNDVFDMVGVWTTPTL